MATDSAQLALDLRVMGIEAGDTVLARGSLRSLGRLSGPGKPAEQVIGALLSVLGPEGTLVGLAFTKTLLFPGRHPEHVFDRGTPPTTGALARAMLAWPGARRSRHPSSSFVAIGRNAELLLSGHDEHAACFSPVERLLELDGKMLNIGVPPDSPGFSTVHVAQLRLGLSTRSILAGRTGVLYRRADGSIGTFWKQDVPGCSRGFYRFYAHYIREEKLTVGHIGQGYALAIRAADAYRIETGLLSRNPRFALCDDPACLFCRGALYYNRRDWLRYYLWQRPMMLLRGNRRRIQLTAAGHQPSAVT
jgi:aminoglycoside N3'-acetyltransferase